MSFQFNKSSIFGSLITLLSFPIQSQDVSNSREAPLMDGNYSITGKAYLEEMTNGDLMLRLDENFNTPAGPDVQVFLSNDPTNVSGGLMVADIGTTDGINHFNGAISWNLGAEVSITKYNFIIFRCIAFGLHWANGNFGEVEEGEMMEEMTDNCSASQTATSNWVSSVSICPGDGEDDIIPFTNTLGAPGGMTYAYILVDENDKIIEIVYGDSYNFENSGNDLIKVYGVSYDGSISFNKGEHITSISATGCAILSDFTTYLTVTKDGCIPEPICLESNVSTINWVSEISICPSDGHSDSIPLLNNLFVPAGDQYAYIFTDENRRIKFLHFEDFYDFEDSDGSTDFIYGLTYSGILSYNVGDHLNTISADGCAQVSSSELFLTVSKDGCMYECVESTTATTDWLAEIEICPSDGSPDVIPLLNNLFIEPGDHYAFIITDQNGNIQFVHLENTFDFEGSGLEIQKVYGISYDGDLSYNIGDPYRSITAGGCSIISASDTFLTVNKTGCELPTAKISGIVQNYNGDGVAGVKLTLNTGDTQTTDNNGTYTFDNLPINKPYTLTPSKEGNILNGVSAQDLVIMSRHILGIQNLNSPYLIIAADANNDEKISALDIINFLNIIIGKTSNLSNNTSWRFVPGDQTFSDVNNPFEFLEKDVIQNLSADVTDLNFIAVKVGDVSGNASTN